MLNFLVGWVGSAKSGLLAENQVSLPDHISIAEFLNPTPNLTLSSEIPSEKSCSWAVSELSLRRYISKYLTQERLKVKAKRIGISMNGDGILKQLQTTTRNLKKCRRREAKQCDWALPGRLWSSGYYWSCLIPSGRYNTTRSSMLHGQYSTTSSLYCLYWLFWTLG